MSIFRKNTVLGAIVFSSADPEKIALTIKGAIPLIITLLPFFGVVNIKESDLAMTIDTILMAITATITLYGLIRKVYINVENLIEKGRGN